MTAEPIVLETHKSPDGVLTFTIERLEDGVIILFFEQSDWHTHPDLLVREWGPTEAAATRNFTDALLQGRSVVGIRRKDNVIVEAWITHDPEFDLDAYEEGETLEMRYWDGQPWPGKPLNE